MPFNPNQSAALVHSDFKSRSSAASGYMTSAAMSAIWNGHWYHIDSKFRSVGLTVTTSASPAQDVAALIESYYTSADFIEDVAARTGRVVAPHAVSLRTRGSAMLQQYIDNPQAMATLTGATLNAALTFRTSGYFKDPTSHLSSISAQDDVTFTRESSF